MTDKRALVTHSPEWALAAIRLGQVSDTKPKRFSGDPDLIVAERQSAMTVPPVDTAAAFMEPERAGVRRGPFRPQR